MYNIVTDLSLLARRLHLDKQNKLCSVADTLDSKDVDLSQMYDIVADLSLFVRRLHPLQQAE